VLAVNDKGIMLLFDVLSVGLLSVVLAVLGPISLLRPWSQVEIKSKIPIKGCDAMFGQYVGLNWITQCNCNPHEQKFLCEQIDITTIEPQYYFIHMGGMLVKVVFIFAMLSALGSIVFIIRKGRIQLKPQNYKPYILLLTVYTTMLYFTALVLWSAFVHSSLDLHFIKTSSYSTSGGWTLCMVSLIISSLAAILQTSMGNSKRKITDDTYLDEGDEGDYESEEDEDYDNENR